MAKKNIFDSKQTVKIPYSFFDLSHSFDSTFTVGTCIPVLATRVLPGDRFKGGAVVELRSNPMVAPVITPVDIDVRFFYARNLLLWPNFDEFLTGCGRYYQGPSNPAVTPHVHPYINIAGGRGTLQDYLMGCGESGITYENLDALPFRMYNMIWNEFYRPEFVTYGATVPKADGNDAAAYYTVRQAGYRRDYFTSASPFSQVGGSVNLQSRVVLDDYQGNKHQKWLDVVGNLVTAGSAKFVQHSGDTWMETSGTANAPTALDPNGTLGVNIDIRDLRRANAVQRFLERSAVNGNRYAEYMLNHFGVRVPDRSQFRPQYLGGGSVPLIVNPVEQTAEGVAAPVGTQAGRGKVNGIMTMNHEWFFPEHGWLMGILCIRPRACYYGGINRQFFVPNDRYGYCIPEFQNVGMDEILNKEISYPPANTFDGDGVFGYKERYLEYKTIPNSVHGELNNSMSAWVVRRDFAGGTNPPSLNHAFCAVQTNALDANMAVGKYPPFVGTVYNKIGALRPLQYRANYKM